MDVPNDRRLIGCKWIFKIKRDGTCRVRLDALSDRIPSTTPGAEPPRDAKDSGSARSHSTHLETSSSYRP